MERGLRGELESRTGPLTDRQWDALVDGRWISEVEDGTRSMDELAEEVREQREVWQDRAAPRDRPAMLRKPASTYYEVLSLLLAEEAGDTPQVREVRETIGGLVPWSELEEWIRDRAQDRRTRWLEVPIPAGHDVRREGARLWTSPPLVISRKYPAQGDWALRARTLAYQVPDDDSVRRVPTAVGGVLEQVRRVAEALSRTYGWQEAQAATFVLTGIPPLIAPIRLTTTLGGHPAVVRLVLDVDVSTSAGEVARRYSEARASLVPGKIRRLSDKHVVLAAFVAERGQETWDERRKAWNKQHPQWSYDATQDANFRRDATVARRRILGLERKAKEGR